MTKKTITFDVTAHVQYAEVIAYGAKKVILDQSNIPIQSGPGKITIPWLGNPTDTVLLDVTLHGNNAYTGFTYSPWFLDIPHQDVLFESASTTIPESEHGKLETTLRDLTDVLDKYGSVIPVQLYIGGCTDTVGTFQYNQTLSEGRAKSMHNGFGPKAIENLFFIMDLEKHFLAESTEDNTENASNRRAIYIVSSAPPTASSGIPKASWKQLP